MDLQETRELLSSRGYLLRKLELPKEVRDAVLARDWRALDERIARETRPGEGIFEALKPYAKFSSIEFIISIRSSNEFPDDDGIWHDDGSRVLAFSLSLTLQPESIEGGRLEIRKRLGRNETASQSSEVIPTPPYGVMIVFATGVSGFEHKINRVEKGERLIIAGWCS